LTTCKLYGREPEKVRGGAGFLSDFSSLGATGSLSMACPLHATGLPTTPCGHSGRVLDSRFPALTVAGDWENKGFVGLDTWYFLGDRPRRRKLVGEGSGHYKGGV
jgi:hypothetical protein